MRIVFAGTPDLAIPGITALIEAGHEIVGIITRADAPLGRKRILTPSPVAEYANTHSIPVFKANTLAEEATSWVENLNADLGVVIAYGGLLKTPMLNATKNGWINLHFSELPKWRGAAPVQRALIAGETNLAVTVFRLVEALDAGEIVATDKWDITPGTSAGEALNFLAQVGAETLLKAVDEIANDPTAGEAQTGDATYAHKLSRVDGKLDFTRKSTEVVAHWAGVTPEPGAWALVDGQSIKIHSIKFLKNPSGIQLEPGEATLLENVVIVGTGDAELIIERVQPAGKQTMDAVAWIHGKNGKATLS
ncbi:MAG TPA: methionyl-tRNA formyltransferase [Microbacteriaceae bacterium]|nr:methionyl-tRNA formyltransferase [Microbacteriaceae bacterium]